VNVLNANHAAADGLDSAGFAREFVRPACSSNHPTQIPFGSVGKGNRLPNVCFISSSDLYVLIDPNIPYKRSILR
jgi:hypothetical protein